MGGYSYLVWQVHVCCAVCLRGMHNQIRGQGGGWLCRMFRLNGGDGYTLVQGELDGSTGLSSAGGSQHYVRGQQAAAEAMHGTVLNGGEWRVGDETLMKAKWVFAFNGWPWRVAWRGSWHGSECVGSRVKVMGGGSRVQIHFGGLEMHVETVQSFESQLGRGNGPAAASLSWEDSLSSLPVATAGRPSCATGSGGATSSPCSRASSCTGGSRCSSCRSGAGGCRDGAGEGAARRRWSGSRGWGGAGLGGAGGGGAGLGGAGCGGRHRAHWDGAHTLVLWVWEEWEGGP